MIRTLLTVSFLALAACGSATTAAPKTTNPAPVEAVAEPKAEAPKFIHDPASGRIAFPQLGFRMTLTTGVPWRGSVEEDDEGRQRILLVREDVPARGVMLVAKAEGQTAAITAYQQREAAKEIEGATLSALLDDSDGRWSFYADRTEGAAPFRTHMIVMPHPSLRDGLLIVLFGLPQAESDAFMPQLRHLLSTVAPL